MTKESSISHISSNKGNFDDASLISLFKNPTSKGALWMTRVEPSINSRNSSTISSNNGLSSRSTSKCRELLMLLHQ